MTANTEFLIKRKVALTVDWLIQQLTSLAIIAEVLFITYYANGLVLIKNAWISV
jgi:hypothetical protein